jgi:hypothetical protein
MLKIQTYFLPLFDFLFRGQALSPDDTVKYYITFCIKSQVFVAKSQQSYIGAEASQKAKI